MPKIEIIHADFWKWAESAASQSVDAIITDPMYDTILHMDILHRICKGNIIAFCAEGKPFFAPDKYAYWVKPTSTKNYSRNLGSFVEWILINRRGDTFNADLHWSNYTGVYDDRLLTKQVHPFEKPISLMERLIAIYTKPGDTILDPFCGSGSTLIAARNLWRNAIGVEIDENYHRLACARLEGCNL